MQMLHVRFLVCGCLYVVLFLKKLLRSGGDAGGVCGNLQTKTGEFG